MKQPTGPFHVSVRDFAYQSDGSLGIAGRLFYPSPHSPGVNYSASLTWIKARPYAAGYMAYAFFHRKGWLAWVTKQLMQTAVYITGLLHHLPVAWAGPLQATSEPLPVVLFSHGASANRNTYSALCCELASQGLLVMALEHADGSAGVAQRPDGSWLYYTGLGTGAALESKCDYRLAECDLALQLLHQLNAGDSPTRFTMSDAADPAAFFKGRLDFSRVALVGHSCGGATAALAAASSTLYSCGVALDPWWNLVPEGSPALQGWASSAPLLIMGSQEWNTPDAAGNLSCNGERQRRVLAAAASPLPVVAAGVGAQAQPGGAVFMVLRGSGHSSFSDLPLLLESRMACFLVQLLRRPGSKVAPSGQEAVDATNAATLAFLAHHLQWTPAGRRLPSSHNTSTGAGEGAQGQLARSGVVDAASDAAAAAGAAAGAVGAAAAATAAAGAAAGAVGAAAATAAAAAAGAGAAGAPALDPSDLQVDIPCTPSSANLKGGRAQAGSLPAWWRGPPARQVSLRVGDEGMYQTVLGDRIMGLRVLASPV